MIRLSFDIGHRWSATLRVAAGTVGAFALGALATTILSLALVRIGVTRADAVTIALLVGPVILALTSLVSFHARSARRAWEWLLAIALPLIIAFIMLRSEMP